MATRTPSNDGYDWGSFPDSSELPNVSGSATQDADLTVGARAFVPGVGAYTCSVATPGAGEWVLTGSFTGGGGGAAIVGPFTCTTAVGIVPAVYGALAWVAPRAGSVTAVSGLINALAADDNIEVAVWIEGIPTAFSILFVDATNGNATATAAAGTYAVTAGQTVVLIATGGPALSNTPDFAGSVEFTPS